VGAPGDGEVRAARWDGGVPTVLGGLPERAAGSRAYAINASGQVAGEWWGGSEREAFVHDGGSLRGLGTLGGPESTARDINDAGQVVGASVVPGQPVSYEVEHAFLWAEGRGMRDLGALPGYRRSTAAAINNAGQVVGASLLGYSQDPEDRPGHRAFRWTAAAGMRPLAGLDGDDGSWATDVNAAGQIVGYHRTAGTFRGFLWSEGGGVRDLGVLPGHDYSYASAVNNRGWAVGNSQRRDGGGRATLFAHGRAIDLNGLIPPGSGWLLLGASDLNDAGQIVGGGLLNGVPQGFLLTPTGAPGAFCDVEADAPYAAAVAQLATVGVVGGYRDGCFGPAVVASRAEAAALLARATPAGPDAPPTTLTPPACLAAGTWDCEDRGNPFADRGGIDPHLWRNVGTLYHHGAARGYDGAACAAQGVASPCFAPNAPVGHAEAVALVARAMVAKGYWQPRPGATQPHAGVPAIFAPEIATYHHYTAGAGGVPAPPSNWNEGASRGWFARVLWQALNAYWGVDRVP
jgi:probable HAF family extracellular repeat protein